ncbi:MAG: universal stress protein [Halobacteriaceae archaeon]
MNIETVLVPVDGTETSLDAAEYAISIANRYSASVHALYVLGEGISRGIHSGDLTRHDVAKDNEAFIEEMNAIGEGQDVHVRSSTAFGFSTTRKSQHPGSVILDCAEEVSADFLVIPREQQAGAADVLEKAAEYVLLYASQPVLSV